ncbi:allophanate hydrolase [Rouxiella silvae]|uniref:Allophanate hydrolase n=1 Tax=Rouxiella silvae TaxID=1646373 RepID=A0AA41BYI9_9GAMM|nr:biotin-dependent carboxyltransferase family protein [Rouxiella silvae]MBF6639207.1 biotin-dependent carboxyltransferase family protein [Rouxiella silvae]ORJ23062.1 allophanate hydrolase [Rouxiella silvae]
MNNGFEVLSPGLFTSLQDLGRFGFEACGVPPSGAMDEMSFAIANALVGNDANTGALEFTLTGATLRLIGSSPCIFAVTGDMALTVDDIAVAPYHRLTLLPGSTLRITRALSGARGYLAVAGGFKVQPVMGSVSTLMRAGLGGFNGRQLQKGDWLALNLSSSFTPDRCSKPQQRPMPQRERRPIRVIAGPQDDHFDAQALGQFLSNEYRVSEQSDRMGYRLTGDPLAHSKGFNIISDAIARGSIQIPGNGQPIVAMNDRQTTGGYPKIATVIRADLARLGQAKPGDRLRFETVSVEKAESLWAGRQALLDAWLNTLREAAQPA